ncbi:MAG: futalosine hydrolase [Bacteroidetes bacterium]|nr:futalosine hydrolase [Bacteroidota bacterium]
MNVLITAATGTEWQEAFHTITAHHPWENQIKFHISGIGIPATMFSIAEAIEHQNPDLIIQAGIAGSFFMPDKNHQTYVVSQEIFADVGVEENGLWMDLFDMGFLQRNDFPYIDKMLINPWIGKYNLLHLQEVKALTVNEMTTRIERKDQLIRKYDPFLESMEGAALHYICLKKSIPFMQLRTISNSVGERDKNKWQMKDAIHQLNDTLIKYLEKLMDS